MAEISGKDLYPEMYQEKPAFEPLTYFQGEGKEEITIARYDEFGVLARGGHPGYTTMKICDVQKNLIDEIITGTERGDLGQRIGHWANYLEKAILASTGERAGVFPPSTLDKLSELAKKAQSITGTKRQKLLEELAEQMKDAVAELKMMKRREE